MFLTIIAGLRLYMSRQASGLGRYVLEQILFFLVGWIPTVIGLGVRAGLQPDEFMLVLKVLM